MGRKLIYGLMRAVALTTATTAAVGTCFAVQKKKDLEIKYAGKGMKFFRGEVRNYKGRVFKGEKIAVAFSGIDINFDDAVLDNNRAVLQITGEYCGISIKVPETWNVKANGTVYRSGVDNKVVFDQEDTKSPLLVINYDIAYSGLEIKRVKVQDEIFDEEDIFVDEGEDDSTYIKVAKI